jgi:Protein of unknown function (DUF3455)
MKKKARLWLGHSLVVASAALLAACSGDASLGPGGQSASSRLSATEALGQLDATTNTGLDNRVPDLTGCPQVAAPVGSQLAFSVYSNGVQIYQWTGTTWAFVAPRAKLFANADYTGLVGNHFGGPTWQMLSGSTVVGVVDQKCVPDANSIAWLLLHVATNEGPGVFEGVTHLQRLNTVGGNAPSTPGSFVGQVVEVPYTANYLFYRAPAVE